MGLGILPHLTGFGVSLGFRWSFETFSTEHFLAAALATRSSSRRFKSRPIGYPAHGSGNFFLDIMSFTISVSMLYARRLGVSHAELEKSMRITRTPSFVKFSRQNGQTEVSRDNILLTILLQKS